MMLGGEGTIEDENPVWVDFAHGLAPLMMPFAEIIAHAVGAGPARVLDVAAGPGMFRIQIAVQNPKAQVAALDWPAVLAVAAEKAEKFGVANRWTGIPGSALSVDYVTGFDVVLLTNFLHHFDQAYCVDILRRVHASLKPGGRAIMLESVPKPDRVTPPSSAAFRMTMMLNTSAGDAYALSQYEAMFGAAGFESTQLAPNGELPEQILVSIRR